MENNVCGYLLDYSVLEGNTPEENYKSFSNFSDVKNFIIKNYNYIERTFSIFWDNPNYNRKKYEMYICYIRDKNYEFYKFLNDTGREWKIKNVYKQYYLTLKLKDIIFKEVKEDLFDYDFIFNHKDIYLKYTVYVKELLKINILFPEVKEPFKSYLPEEKKEIEIILHEGYLMNGEEIEYLPFSEGFEKYLNKGKDYTIYKIWLPLYIIKIKGGCYG